MDYTDFLQTLDDYLEKCFKLHESYIYCKKGCSSCCEEGDYPLSQRELEFLMQGYISLDNETKRIVQNQIKVMEKGKACPFLINKCCSIYNYRPIICRVHGLAYICKENTVKVPYCANEGKNYSSVYKDGTIEISPISRNLDTKNLLDVFYDIELKNMYDWLK